MITANQEGAEAATRKLDSTPISNTRVTLPIYSEHLTSETLQATFFFELGATAVSRRAAADSILSGARETLPDV